MIKHVIESKIDTDKTWYLGNNYKKNFKVVQPAWNKPFFLTTDIKYAKEYSDYGVYKVTLKDAITSEICDFSNSAEVKKLNWPIQLIKQINTGKTDLNSIAYDLYLVEHNETNKLYTIKNDVAWKKVITYFAKVKMPPIKIHSQWLDEKDYKYLLKMWADIYNKGFNGFTHDEFGNKIIALFEIDLLDKISNEKIA